MYCPKCRSEYQPQVVFCQACRVSLVDDPKRLTPEEQRRYEQELQVQSVLECQNCGTHNAVSARICSKCGGPLTPEEAFAEDPFVPSGLGTDRTPVAKAHPVPRHEGTPVDLGKRRYGTLSGAAALFETLGWLGVIFGVGLLVATLILAEGPAKMFALIGPVLALTGMLIVLAAQAIRVFCDIEDNTRIIAELLKQQARK